MIQFSIKLKITTVCYGANFLLIYSLVPERVDNVLRYCYCGSIAVAVGIAVLRFVEMSPVKDLKSRCEAKESWDEKFVLRRERWRRA